jgi:hypothetical protein
MARKSAGLNSRVRCPLCAAEIPYEVRGGCLRIIRISIKP